MATMLIHNIPPNGCAGAAPTFTMSDAPVYQPNPSAFAGAFVKAVQPESETLISPIVLDSSDNSNKTTGTSVSSQTNSNVGGPVVYLDIEKVKNTYYMNSNRKLISSFVSTGNSRKEISNQTDPAMSLVPEPKIRVALNQMCCSPGETLEGSIFCDLSSDSDAIGPFGLCENMEDEIKLLVTFHGVERATIFRDDGDPFSTERDVYRRTKEIGCFNSSTRRGMHNFSFDFKVPEDAPASCNIHSCHFGKNAGVGTITYSVVATLQGSVGIVSLEGNGSVFVKSVGKNVGKPSRSGSHFKTGRNSNKILRWRQVERSRHSSSRNSSHSSARSRHHAKSVPYVYLDKTIVPLDEPINVKVNLARIKHGLVKAKKLSVKLIRIIELRCNGLHQRWERTEFEQNFDVRSHISIDLQSCNEKVPLRPSAESELVSNKYVVQVRARTSLGGILGGHSPVVLPVTLISGHSCSVLPDECDGMCNKVKPLVHLPPKEHDHELVPTEVEERNHGLRKVQSLHHFSPRDEMEVEEAEETVIKVNNPAEKRIVENKVLALEIARQQLVEAQNRTAEAENELKETIRTMSKRD